MAKRKITKERLRINGWVYIMSITIQGKSYKKIGTTNRTPRHRLLEIAGEIFDAIGYIPVMTIVTAKQTQNNYVVEKAILDQTIKHKPGSDCVLWDKFNGFGEMRSIDKDVLVAIYTECLNKDYPVIQPTLVTI